MKKLISIIIVIAFFAAAPVYAKHNNSSSYNKRYTSNSYYNGYNCRSSCGGSAYYSIPSYYPSYDYVGSNYIYSNYGSGCNYGCYDSYNYYGDGIYSYSYYSY